VAVVVVPGLAQQPSVAGDDLDDRVSGEERAGPSP
jgi:hypothetical protein